jgi:hypothetical protein
MFLAFLRQPIIEPLGKIPIFDSGNWEVCHEEVIALLCFGNGFTCKFLEAHPRISVIALLVNLSDESSQMFCREESQCKPPEGVVDCRWLRSEQNLPCETTHKHREVDQFARLIILARIILCNL